MHSDRTYHDALRLHESGATARQVAVDLRVPLATVRHWLRGERRTLSGQTHRCPRCGDPPGLPADGESYAYLLGLYLGDGHLVTSGRVPQLSIFCTAIYPGLIDACGHAMTAVLARRFGRLERNGCVKVQSYGKHWPCLLPQHGPGKKHDRPIVLEPWQREVVGAQPRAFVRGLFHSDGCRTENRVRGHGRWYAYPRYMFTNKSTDIMGLCQWGLDLLGVAWRMARPDSLSVARRDSVAILDRWVGPKH